MSQYGNNGQGEAASYYNQQQQAPQNDQRNPNSQQGQGSQPDGPSGERGVLGAIGGGVAGGFGGHAAGGKKHSTLGTVLGVVGGALAGHKLQDGVSDWKDGRDDKKAEEKKAEEDKKAEEKRKAEEKKKDEERKKDEEKKKSEKKEEKKDNRDCQQSSAPGVKYLGNFSGSAKDIRVDCSGEYLLHASCKSKDGSYRASSISLNKILSNDRGSFRWVEGGSQPKAAGPKQFTVRQGDTLRAIGAQVGASWEEIARVNGIQNPDLIHPGQVLNIPGGAADSGCNGGGVGNFGGSARNVKLVDSGRRLEAELKRDGQWVGSSIVLDERIGNDNGCLAFKS